MEQHTIFTSILITILILCALAIFLIVYFLLYNRKLNKAVKEGHADRPMPSVSVYSMMFLCMVFLAAAVFTVSGIMELGGRLDKLAEDNKTLKEEHSSLHEYVAENRYGILGIRNNLEGSTLLDTWEFTYGDYHPDTHMVDATIRVMPKVASSKDTITFYYEDQAVPLTRQYRDIYEGSFQANVFNYRMEGLLTIETEKTTLSEIITEKGYNAFDINAALDITNYIPTFGIHTELIPDDQRIRTDQPYQQIIDKENHTLRYLEDFYFKIEPPAYIKDFAVTSAKLIYHLNDQTTQVVDLTDKLEKDPSAEGSYTIGSTLVDVQLDNFDDDEDKFHIFLSITDNHGYTYAVKIYSNRNISNISPITPNINDRNYHLVAVYKDGQEVTLKARGFFRMS